MSTAYDVETPGPTTSPQPRVGRKFTMSMSDMPRTGPELYLEQLSVAVGAGQDEEVTEQVIAWLSDAVGKDAIQPAAEWNGYLLSLVGTRFPHTQIVHVRRRMAATAAAAGGPLPLRTKLSACSDIDSRWRNAASRNTARPR